jgi:hypothetical protein
MSNQRLMSNYARVKKLSKTSEDYFEIPHQPANTCPLIDRVISDIESVKICRDEVDVELRTAKNDLTKIIKDLRYSTASDDKDVSKAIRELEQVLDSINQAESADLYLPFKKERNIVDQLEDIRSNCENIRNWGQEWKDLFLSVLNAPLSLFRILLPIRVLYIFQLVLRKKTLMRFLKLDTFSAHATSKVGLYLRRLVA